MALAYAPAQVPAQEPEPLLIEYDRDLTQEDLLVLSTTQLPAKNTIKRLTYTHHSIARLVAIGEHHVVISAKLDVSVSHIKSLMADPAFNELVSHYKSNADAALADFQEQLAGLGTRALTAMRERLDNSPDDISTKELLAIGEMTMDRLGHGPTKTLKVQDQARIIAELKSMQDSARTGMVTIREET